MVDRAISPAVWNSSGSSAFSLSSNDWILSIEDWIFKVRLRRINYKKNHRRTSRCKSRGIISAKEILLQIASRNYKYSIINSGFFRLIILLHCWFLNHSCVSFLFPVTIASRTFWTVGAAFQPRIGCIAACWSPVVGIPRENCILWIQFLKNRK